MERIRSKLNITELGPIRFVGKKTTVKLGSSAEKFVRSFREDGSNDTLQKSSSRITPQGDIIVYMGEYDSFKRSFTEIPGVFMSPKSEVPDGYAYRDIPQCNVAMCVLTGKTRELSKNAHSKLLKLLKGSGYEPDYTYGFSMEYYSYEKYEKDNDEYEFIYILPCKRSGTI